MKKYQEALNTITKTLGYYMDCIRVNIVPSFSETHDAVEVIRELTDKADSFEWIPVSKKLPDEHDSIFAKLCETDVLNDMLWRTRSKDVLVTIEYEDGARTVKSSHTTDGKWVIEKKATFSKCKVVAWMPLPKPYKEKKNERY